MALEQESVHQVVNGTEIEQRINENADQFVKGLHSWGTKKKKLIEAMAEDFRELIDNRIKVKNVDFGNYEHKNICSLVCDKLEEHNVPVTAFSYVRAILSKKDYTDASILQLLKGAMKHIDNYNEEIDELQVDDFSKFDFIPRDVYAKLPIEEKIRVKKHYMSRSKERKTRDRENREMMDSELIKEGINPESIKDSNIDAPPANLWGESPVSIMLGDIEEKYQRLTDIFHDFKELSKKFRPDDELAHRVVERLKPMRDLLIQLQIEFFSGYPDQKNAYTFPQWFDKLLSEFYEIETPEIVRKSLLTGEFAAVDRDGEQVIIPLERKITNKHVKDRLEEMEVQVRKLPLFAHMFSALELYVRKQATLIGDPKDFAKIKETWEETSDPSNEYNGSSEPRQAQEIIT